MILFCTHDALSQANALVEAVEKVKHFLFSFLVLHASDFLLYYSGNNE